MVSPETAPATAPETMPGTSTAPKAAPDLSILIVSWNTRAMTRACLASVEAGLAGPGAPTVEMIVVDNASTDGSAEMIAAEFPRVRLIHNTENRGFAAANNQGFAIARGRHVLLLNSDTLVHGDVLAASVAWLDAHPRSGAMGCRVLNTDGSVQLTCSMYPSLLNLALQLSGLGKVAWPTPLGRVLGRYRMPGWARDSTRAVEVISGCYLMVRRSVIDTVGGLNEAFFFYGEETDWCRRIRAAGWELTFAPVGEITHHGGGSVRALDHRRDVLLSEATVRLHRKHAGRAGGLAAFGLTVAFNASRALYWSLRAGVSPGNTHARTRARHFRAVLAATPQIWPRPAPSGTTLPDTAGAAQATARPGTPPPTPPLGGSPGASPDRGACAPPTSPATTPPRHTPDPQAGSRDHARDGTA